MKALARILMTGWSILIISIVSMVLGFIAASGSKYSGVAFLIFFLWFCAWVLMKYNGYFK